MPIASSGWTFTKIKSILCVNLGNTRSIGTTPKGKEVQSQREGPVCCGGAHDLAFQEPSKYGRFLRVECQSSLESHTVLGVPRTYPVPGFVGKCFSPAI